MSKQVNWTALNERLCEALKVPHAEECRCNSCCRTTRERAFAFVEYHNIISVDALMPLLAARDIPHGVQYRTEFNAFQGWVRTGDHYMREKKDPGYALSLAAAAALGVEVPYV